MKEIKLDIIAGARPNFMKIAPIIEAIRTNPHLNIKYRLIHTGQHYDAKMSDSFFEQLQIPKPDVNLYVGSGTQAEQTAAIMVKYEKVLMEDLSDFCLVVGDVTSTLAASIAAKKLGVKILHVEAGIRSGDISMPEEVNRIVTDSITDFFFTTTLQAVENLLKSGISREKIFFVGNTMIDSLLKNLHRLRKPIMWDLHKLKEKEYFLLTLHRPVNVDRPENLKNILHELIGASNGYPVVFPVHPRTMKSIDKLDEKFGNVHLIEPLGYLEFIYLLKHSRAVITDSGGITEEATVLDIPCMTLRDTTERPETCTMGTNLLIGNDPRKLKAAINRVFNNEWKKGCIPDLWDGKASERIIQSFKKF